jgi:hypothetical protein
MPASDGDRIEFGNMNLQSAIANRLVVLLRAVAVAGEAG